MLVDGKNVSGVSKLATPSLFTRYPSPVGLGTRRPAPQPPFLALPALICQLDASVMSCGRALLIFLFSEAMPRSPRGRWNEGAGRRRVAGDGVPRGRRRAAGVRRDRAHRAGRAALCFAERVPHVYGARCLRQIVIVCAAWVPGDWLTVWRRVSVGRAASRALLHLGGILVVRMSVYARVENAWRGAALEK